MGRKGGGGGAGGWIYGTVVGFMNETHNIPSTQNWNGRFNLSSGLSASKIFTFPREIDDVHSGRTSHPNCPAGFEGIFCSPCVLGFFQAEYSTNMCIPCLNKPDQNSIYTFVPGQQTSESCPYECISSVPNREKNPKCLNSFDWFISRIGGWAVVICMLIFIAICIFILWCYIRMKAIKRAKYKAKYSFDNIELNDKRRIFEDDDFKTADLPYQICRAYFRGTNIPGNQWTIPVEPPNKLKNKVFISSYEEFATLINDKSKWSMKEKIWYTILMIFFPPFLPIFVRYIRKKKFKKLRSVISEAQGGIWLNSSKERETNLPAKVVKLS